MGCCYSLFSSKKTDERDDAESNTNFKKGKKDNRSHQQNINSSKPNAKESSNIPTSQFQDQDVTNEEMTNYFFPSANPSKTSSGKHISRNTPKPLEQSNDRLFISREKKINLPQKLRIYSDNKVLKRNFEDNSILAGSTSHRVINNGTEESKRTSREDRNAQQHGFKPVHWEENIVPGRSYADALQNTKGRDDDKSLITLTPSQAMYRKPTEGYNLSDYNNAIHSHLQNPNTETEYMGGALPKAIVLKVKTIDDSKTQPYYTAKYISEHKPHLQPVTNNSQYRNLNNSLLETSFGPEINTTIGQTQLVKTKNNDNFKQITQINAYPGFSSQDKIGAVIQSNHTQELSKIKSTDATLAIRGNKIYVADSRKVEPLSRTYYPLMENSTKEKYLKDYLKENYFKTTPIDYQNNTKPLQGARQGNREQVLPNKNTVHAASHEPENYKDNMNVFNTDTVVITEKENIAKTLISNKNINVSPKNSFSENYSSYSYSPPNELNNHFSQGNDKLRRNININERQDQNNISLNHLSNNNIFSQQITNSAQKLNTPSKKERQIDWIVEKEKVLPNKNDMTYNARSSDLLNNVSSSKKPIASDVGFNDSQSLDQNNISLPLSSYCRYKIPTQSNIELAKTMSENEGSNATNVKKESVSTKENDTNDFKFDTSLQQKCDAATNTDLRSNVTKLEESHDMPVPSCDKNNLLLDRQAECDEERVITKSDVSIKDVTTHYGQNGGLQKNQSLKQENNATDIKVSSPENHFVQKGLISNIDDSSNDYQSFTKVETTQSDINAYRKDNLVFKTEGQIEQNGAESILADKNDPTYYPLELNFDSLKTEGLKQGTYAEDDNVTSSENDFFKKHTAFDIDVNSNERQGLDQNNMSLTFDSHSKYNTLTQSNFPENEGLIAEKVEKSFLMNENDGDNFPFVINKKTGNSALHSQSTDNSKIDNEGLIHKSENIVANEAITLAPMREEASIRQPCEPSLISNTDNSIYSNTYKTMMSEEPQGSQNDSNVKRNYTDDTNIRVEFKNQPYEPSLVPEDDNSSYLNNHKIISEESQDSKHNNNDIKSEGINTSDLNTEHQPCFKPNDQDSVFYFSNYENMRSGELQSSKYASTNITREDSYTSDSSTYVEVEKQPSQPSDSSETTTSSTFGIEVPILQQQINQSSSINISTGGELNASFRIIQHGSGKVDQLPTDTGEGNLEQQIHNEDHIRYEDEDEDEDKSPKKLKLETVDDNKREIDLIGDNNVTDDNLPNNPNTEKHLKTQESFNKAERQNNEQKVLEAELEFKNNQKISSGVTTENLDEMENVANSTIKKQEGEGCSVVTHTQINEPQGDLNPEIFKSVARLLEQIRKKAEPFENEIENFTELEDSNKYYFIEESLRRLIDNLDDLFDDIGENKVLRNERKKVYKYIFPLFDRLDDKVEENKIRINQTLNKQN